MIRSLFSVVFGCLLCLISFVQGVMAQSAACQSYRAELAAIESRGGGRQATRQRQEIDRAINYYQSLGCGRGQFLFFGSSPSSECGPLGERIRRLEANFARMEAQSGAGAYEGRRQQLIAALQTYCQPVSSSPPAGYAPPGLVRGGMFNDPGLPPQKAPSDPRGDWTGDQIIEDEEPVRKTASKAICVRSCDGFFFPLSNMPGGRESANEMCHALCPATETKAYYTSRDFDLNNATSLNGTSYSQLNNAFRYQKTFDASCSCRGQGQSWASVLQEAENMIARRRSDIVVTAQKAEELSKPKLTNAPKDIRKIVKPISEVAPVTGQTQAEVQEIGVSAISVPTAGTSSSGIGPQNIEGEKVVGKTDGQRQNVVDQDGKRKNIRIIDIKPQ